MKLASTPSFLQPTPSSLTSRVVVLLLLCCSSVCFTFSSVSIAMDSNQVATQTTYYFQLDRQYDDSLATTPWASTPVPSQATAAIRFPAEYASSLIANAVCTDVQINDVSISGYSCAVSGNDLVVSNAFAAGSLVYGMYVTVAGIVNPGSTVTTSPFTATIATDSSGSSSSAQVTFEAGQLASLSISFVGGIVNQTNDMLITFVTSHSIPQNGTIQVIFPNTITWNRDLSPSHTIPINGTLACYGVTTNIKNTTIACQGLFSTQTIKISSPFSQSISPSQTITFAIKGLFAPPTTQPIDKLKVITCDASFNSIDSATSFISGLLPQALQNFVITPTVSPFGVNSFAGGLSFSFLLPDTISSGDYFIISFSSGTTISLTTKFATIAIQSATYNATNSSIVIFQSSFNQNYPAGTSITLSFIKYKAPPSTRPTSSITLTVFSFGYSKMSASGSISAVANNYTLSVAAASTTVNAFTSYSFSFTMADALTSAGYISLTLDPNLCKTAAQTATIQSNLSISISGTNIKPNPSTQIVATTVNVSATYSLVFTNLNTSASNIPTQSLTIKVSNLLNYPSVLSMSYFALSTYYSASSVDLVANANYAGTLTLQPGSIKLVSVTSTATTTYTFGTLSIQLTNQNPIPANGCLMVVFPTDLNVLSVFQGSVTVSSTLVSATAINYVSNNSIILKPTSQISANTSLKVVIGNSLTQNTTKTTATFVVKTYDQSFNPIDASSNNLGLSIQSGNPFNSLTITRSNTTNSANANYTLYFQQVQNSSYISAVGISFNQFVSTSSLSRVYQQLYNPSNGSYYLVALVFYKINSTYVRVVLNQTSVAHTIILSTVTNPPSQQPISNSILVYTLTNDYQYIYSQMYTEDIINDAASTDVVTSFSFSSLAFEQSDTLTLGLQQPNAWPALVFSLQIDIPMIFGTSDIGCSGFTGIVCSLFPPTKVLTITASNGSNLPSSFSVIISNLVNPAVGSSSQTFTIISYDSNSYMVQQDISTVVYNNLCTMPCRTCSSSNYSSCTSCYTSPSTYPLLYQTQCLNKCPNGSYQFNSTLCVSCNAECATCSYASSNCTSCNATSQYAYLYQNTSLLPVSGTCLFGCKAQTYELNKVCYDCNSSCSSCTNSTHCNACKVGYYLFKDSCVAVCPNTTITSNSSCEACSANCLTCIQTVDSCTSCPSYTFLSNSSCLSSCPQANMFVNNAQTCQLCNSNCATCSLSSTNCTSCNLASTNSHLYNSTCVASCPELYYSNASTLVCVSCASLAINCSNCSSSTTCYTCDADYLFLMMNSTCTKQVPVGYLALNGTIYSCDSTCYSCDGSSSNCLSCSGSLNLYNNQCIIKCPTSITVAISNVCQPCKYPCATCLNLTTTCTSCLANSTLYYSQAANNCVPPTGCQSGTFANSANFICSNCSSSCLLCSGSSTNCSVCKNGYFYYSSNNSCLASCPNGSVGINGTCQSCNPPCRTCNMTQNMCTSCAVSSPSLYLNTNSSNCVSSQQCPSNTYPNATQLVCQSCPFPCSGCTSYSQCTSCQGNYSLFYTNETCLQSCPDGWIAQPDGPNMICLSCVDPCATCKGSLNNCTSCKANSSLYLQGNSCVNASQCLNLTYPNSTTNKCTLCQQPCLSCSSETSCTTCTNGTYLYISSCLNSSSCPSGTVAGVNSSTGLNQCVLCTYPCLTCSVVANNCTSCNSSAASFYLSGNLCGNASSCPNLTYPNSTTSKCQSCLDPCLSCINSTHCSSCIPGYFLSPNSTCVSLCSVGQYAMNVSGTLLCNTCSNSCFQCYGNASNCTSCNNGTYLSNGSCLAANNCPQGTYANSTKNTCEVCLSPCSSCANSTFCQSCLSSYVLPSTGGCVNSSSCPNNTVAYNDSGVLKCSQCESSCNGCISSPTFCSTCADSSTFLQNGSCVNSSSCLPGTYPNITLRTCSKCQASCNECQSLTFCTSCISSLYLVVPKGSCVNSSSCPAGTTAFVSNGASICAACSSSCQNCRGTPSNCTSCAQNSSTYFQNNGCVAASQCVNGSYPDSTTLTCSICPSSCALCSAKDSCSKCTANFYLYGATCLSNCLNGTFADISTSTCKSCNSPCKTCNDSADICTSCQQNNTTLYLLDNSCVIGTSCIAGTYPNSTTFTCSSCNQNCATCSSSFICTSCVSGFYLYSSKTCVNVCPDGYLGVLVNTGGICQQCSSVCSTCNNTITTCTSCASGTFLQNNICVATCPNGTATIQSTSTCQMCQQGCTLCSLSTSNCSTCGSGYFYYNSTCSQVCPNGYYADGSNNNCSSCSNNCTTCANSTACLSCSPPLSFYSSQCLLNCPQAFSYSVSSVCMNCSSAISGCLSCSNGSRSASCQICLSGLLMFNGSCYYTCPAGSQTDGAGNCKQSQSSSNSTLTDSLTTAGLFPLPFTIIGSIIFVACFISKLQNRNTYTLGVAYSLYGFIETACLSFVLLTFSPEHEKFKIFLLIALFVIGGLNLFGLIVQTWQLSYDEKFSKWLKTKCNFVFYGIIVVISALTNYKFKLILFTKLFNFKCVRAQLEHVQKFRVFNLMSFLGVVHQGLVVYVSALILVKLSPNTSQFLIFLDLIIVNSLNVVLALAASSKSETFFEEEEQDGMKVNKVFNLHDEYQLNPIDDTLDHIKKQKGVESRDVLMDDEEQFTLSMSDRSESAVKGQAPETGDKFAMMKQNKSMFQKIDLGPEQESNIGKKGLNNMSAVYQRDLKKEKRKKFQAQHKISKVILEKTEKQSNQRLSESEQKIKGEESHATLNNLQGAEQDLELPQQTSFIPDLELAKGEMLEDVQNRPQDQPKVQHQFQINQIISFQRDNNLEKRKKLEDDDEKLQKMQQNKREIKVYKGKGEIIPSSSQDIQEIDLTISKKQKQLIQLRKSIRKRQQSQEKKSQRQQRSKSKDKKSKRAQSQREADFVSSNFPQKTFSQELSNQKTEIKRIPLNINMLDYGQSGIIQEELVAATEDVSMPTKGSGWLGTQNEDIEDNIKQEYIKAPLPNRQKIEEVINKSSFKQTSQKTNQVQAIKEDFQMQTITYQQADKKMNKLVQNLNRMAFQDQEITQNQDAGEDDFEHQQFLDEQSLQFHQHFFQEQKELSFLSQEFINDPNNLVQGMKAPSRKQKKLLDSSGNNQPSSNQQLRINLNIKADEQNTPLKSKKNKKGALQGQVPGEDNFQDQTQRTQKVRMYQNRSHLLKDQSSKRDSAQYQQLQDTSFKEFAARKTAFERPPLQNRPSTSVKNRQATGVQNMQTNRADLRSKEGDKWNMPNQTMRQGQFKQFKSKEIQLQGGSNLEFYPSSFSSNQFKLGSEELNDEPRKPTIMKNTKTKSRGNSQKKLTPQQQSSVDNKSMKKSVKSYKSRSIDRQQAQKGFRKIEELESDDLKQYYNRKDRSKSNKSKSKSREGNRSSEKKMRELEKIYLQRLQFKQ